jgi:hypothetical protein
VISPQARERTVAALHALGATGRYADMPGGPVDPAATLSVVRALGLLGARPADPDAIHADVLGRAVGGRWALEPGAAPAVLPTAVALLTLNAIGALASLVRWLRPAVDWMAGQAWSREDHLMTIVVVAECGAGAAPSRSVAFFRELESPDGTFGPSPVQNGVAAAALLRAGETLADPAAVTRLLLAAQTPDGGFAEPGADADLSTTYWVMRALDLLGVRPDTPRLTGWLRSRTGGVSAGATYECLSVLDWIATPVIDAARRGDVAAVSAHLEAGGDPDIRDLTGWTPLAAAAVGGRARVVRLLLAGEHPADADLRVPEADALPIHWAGQAGDLDTVRALLAYRPEHLWAVSSTTGHTVLLQAVFFGTDRHRMIVAWLIEHVGDILALPSDQVQHARRRMLAACDVHGHTARTMAERWRNEPVAKLLAVVDDTTDRERDDYRRALFAAIADSPAPRGLETAGRN